MKYNLIKKSRTKPRNTKNGMIFTFLYEKKKLYSFKVMYI